MTTFFMFGKYTMSGLEGASSTRTKQVEHLIARFDGKVRGIYALLGDKDVILIVDLPSVEDAIKVSASLSKLTGISFVTAPAIPAEDFDIFVQVDK